MNDDINNYIPSVLNPRAIRKENTGNSTFLTQVSYFHSYLPVLLIPTAIV